MSATLSFRADIAEGDITEFRCSIRHSGESHIEQARLLAVLIVDVAEEQLAVPDPQ